VTALENHQETVYPLLRVLADTGFLERFEDPVDLKAHYSRDNGDWA
jgi:Fe2+ or Zn2+ uptake regulation protein